MIWIVLTVIFAVLKLVGIVGWPWLWVFSPLLVMIALAFLSFLLVAFAIATFIEEPTHRYLLLPFAAIALVMLVGFGWWIALVPLLLLAIYMIYLAVEWSFGCICLIQQRRRVRYLTRTKFNMSSSNIGKFTSLRSRHGPASLTNMGTLWSTSRNP